VYGRRNYYEKKRVKVSKDEQLGDGVDLLEERIANDIAKVSVSLIHILYPLIISLAGHR
jgi:hypothetical protein